MFQKLKTLLDVGDRSSNHSRHVTETVIAPEHSMYAVGDIHGCEDSLIRLMNHIDAEATGDEPIVFVGDLIDRGPQSAQVLERLRAMTLATPGRVIVLMGNHERMMLDFIDDPSDEGARWLLYGGLDTLTSFGINGVSERPDAEEALEIANALERVMPADMLAWLRALPLYWANGNVCCVHAAMNPDKPLAQQSERSLLWGHPKFFKQPRTDGLCVVHGHTIVSQPSVSSGRIAIDTGAYRGGRLSAARLDNGNCRFLQT